MRQEGEGDAVRPRYKRIGVENDWLADAARKHRFYDDTTVPFLCECDDDACRALVPLTLRRYRDWSGRFAITIPGHSVAGAASKIATEDCALHDVQQRREFDD
jgi:hypothetical protein